ncbi:MAG: hypothetical protein O3C40_11975 [Planctomycetota bacterium]|nr:hypothetical protein [Planctomycetota bacterium]
MFSKNFLTYGWRRLPDDGRLSIGAAGGCFVAEAVGRLANLFFPESLNVVGIGIVGCFYLLLGVISLTKGRPEQVNRQPPANDSKQQTCVTAVANEPECVSSDRHCDVAQTRRCISLESKKVQG